MKVQLHGLTWVIICGLAFLAASADATEIQEVLTPPATPGNAYTGTFIITPSISTWAFGVGNPNIEDTSISGIKSINGLPAKDHWISSLISRSTWDAGYDFDSIRPIGATSPSSFSIDTSVTAWQWGTNDYVAFYWLSEAREDQGAPLGVLQSGVAYDAFHFFTSGPASPFATFSAADGGVITTGETDVIIVPEPAAVAMLLVGLPLVYGRPRRLT